LLTLHCQNIHALCSVSNISTDLFTKINAKQHPIQMLPLSCHYL